MLPERMLSSPLFFSSGHSFARIGWALAALLSLGLAPPAVAQSSHSQSTYYVRTSTGLSDYTGDAGGGLGFADFFDSAKFDQEAFPFVWTGEAGYRLSPPTSLVFGYQFGQYPFASGASDRFGTTRHTLQVLGRQRFGDPTWLVRPYADAGLNVTVGGDALGAGPSLGGGLSASINDRVAIYVESRLHFVLGDAAVDGAANGVPFDVLSALPATGVRVDL